MNDAASILDTVVVGWLCEAASIALPITGLGEAGWWLRWRLGIGILPWRARSFSNWSTDLSTRRDASSRQLNFSAMNSIADHFIQRASRRPETTAQRQSIAEIDSRRGRNRRLASLSIFIEKAVQSQWTQVSNLSIASSIS